jgi:hydrogenase/urease accessory protein HupE
MRALCITGASLFALLCLSVSSALSAHEGRPVFVEVTEETESRYSFRWKIPPVMADSEIPMIRLNGCQLAAGAPRPSLHGQHIYECEIAPHSIELKYPGKNPVLSTLVMLRRTDGFEQSHMAGPDEMIIPLPQPESFLQVASRYTYTGMDHILEGYDHLLFVMCLMLLSGSLRRILITVTGFTLGHSITLGMSALAGWSLPPTFVEPLIVFSILILAVEIAKNQKTTLAFRYPASVSIAFGLLHGFGFGGYLTEVGLPYGMKLQALAFFNIGVELGQVLFVIIAYAAYRITTEAAKVMRINFKTSDLKPLAIYPAGIIAAYWTIERVSGIW